MTIGSVPAALAALSAFLILLPSGRPPLPVREPRPVTPADTGWLRRLRPVLAALAVAGGWSLLGGIAGLAAGSVAAAWAWRVLGSGDGPAARKRRAQLEEELPLAVHLLGACLRAGAAVGPALATVGASLPGAVAEEFAAIGARLDLGADPVEVWSEVAEGGPLAPLGQALLRSHSSGASVTTVVDRLCTDLRAERRSRTGARARTVEVRASVPLGVCLLPAFLLLGVVPMSVGVFGAIDFLH